MLTRQRNKLLSSSTRIEEGNSSQSVGIVLCCSVESYDGSSFKCDITDQNQNSVYIAIKRNGDDNSESSAPLSQYSDEVQSDKKSFSERVERKTGQRNDLAEVIGKNVKECKTDVSFHISCYFFLQFIDCEFFLSKTIKRK